MSLIREFGNRTTATNDCTDMESRLRWAKGLNSRSIGLFSSNPYILLSRPIPIHSISCRVNRPGPYVRYSFEKTIQNIYHIRSRDRLPPAMKPLGLVDLERK